MPGDLSNYFSKNIDCMHCIQYTITSTSVQHTKMTSKVMQISSFCLILCAHDFIYFYTQNIHTLFKFKQIWICWATVILKFSQVIKTFTTFISTSLTMLRPWKQNDVTQTVICIHVHVIPTEVINMQCLPDITVTTDIISCQKSRLPQQTG